MIAIDMDATPAPADIINAYRLALGREPEVETVIEERLHQPKREWLPGFFDNDEFRGNVYATVLAGGDLPGVFASGPPSAELRAWAAAELPLTPPARDAVRAAWDWFGLFHALFSDPDFAEALPVTRAYSDDAAFVAALDRRSRGTLLDHVRGAVELVSGGEVRGWAIDVRDPDRRLALELRIGGRFAAAGATGLFRRELQDRFGGGGRVGFAIPFAVEAAPGHPPLAEVREAASGLVIGTFRLPDPDARPIDAVADLRDELADLRAMLERIERKLPAVHAGLGFPLDNYPAYHRAYYEPREAATPRNAGTARATAIVDAFGASSVALAASLDSLAEQRMRPAEVVIAAVAGDPLPEVEDLVAHWRAGFGPARVRIAAAPDWTAAHRDALAAASEEVVLFVPGVARLAPDAVALLVAEVENGAAIAFSDEDATDARGRHAAPVLRTAFDPDLVLQQDGVGDLLAVRRAEALQLGLRPEHAGAGLYDLVLRAGAGPEPLAIRHVPRVLLTRDHARDAQATQSARLAAVQDLLLENAAAEPHEDLLGAAVPGALRIRRAVPDGLTVSIIIPTRDRVDLLAPCLSSVVATAAKGRARVEVLLVDNGSREAETHAFLQTAARMADVRVLEHPGAFNWALINNRAAEQARGDVLVFLNNDTAALSPDCWDELGAQAIRPEVGAVGARLLYEDGTIQHAGMVTDPWHSFASHEGVGDPGADPGYAGRHALLRQVATVTGACLATRAALFREVGGFDALHFPAEGNDTDYCLRLRARGLRILYDPYATLYHYESKSRGFNLDDVSRTRAEEATRTLQARWGERFADDPFYNPHFDRLRPPCRWLQPPP